MSVDMTALQILDESLKLLAQGFDELPPHEPIFDSKALGSVMRQLAVQMQDNFPYHHPLYAGQMLKPPHPIARLAYMLSLSVNPNNHALDGGRASSRLEKEAVAEIAKMFGWQQHLAHLTSGGTMANLEALWIANQLHPGKTIVASEQAHYTHERICGVLQIPYKSVESDHLGRMSVDALKNVLKEKNIGTVVVTLGTTATGSVDPLPEILKLKDEYGFRIHVDSAYGGYFGLVSNLDENAAASFSEISKADSIVVDPHKHGLQPYGCGCVLFKDPEVGAIYKHDSPYTYFSSDELHLGEISLECSRPGSAAAALWATQKLFPLEKGGVFASNLEKSREAAVRFHTMLEEDDRFLAPFPPELDIVIYAPKADKVSDCSKLSQRIFKLAAERNLHLALANLPRKLLEPNFTGLEWDQDKMTCLRSCLMKPEHLEWLDQIYSILSQCVNDVRQIEVAQCN
jgi:tyrosine decarboxylase / aspartate 1-decarboxylase